MKKAIVSYGLLTLSMVFALGTPLVIKNCCMELLEVHSLLQTTEVGEDPCCKDDMDCCQPEFKQIDWQSDALTVSHYSVDQAIEWTGISVRRIVNTQSTPPGGEILIEKNQFPPGGLPPIYKRVQVYLI